LRLHIILLDIKKERKKERSQETNKQTNKQTNKEQAVSLSLPSLSNSFLVLFSFFLFQRWRPSSFSSNPKQKACQNLSET